MSSRGQQNDFSAGDHTGALRHRPAQYVPVRVPLYNEQGSIDDKLAVASQGEKTGDLTPRFNWVYRPELSFSVVDLEVESIMQKNQDSTADSGNLLDDDIPAINNSYDLVEVIFNLIGSEYERITALDGEQQYIFALGDQEIQVSIDKGQGNDQQIRFTNLDYLSQLDVEDYLTLSLYLNQDAQNVLWEWGFEYLYIEPETIGHNDQTDDTYYITADDPVVNLKAGISGYAYRDSDTKSESRVQWQVEGDGHFSTSVQPANDLGLFDNSLIMPSLKGSRGTVSVSLTDSLSGSSSNKGAKWKAVEVLAGKPASIHIEKSAANVVSLGQSDVRLDITVTDGSSAHNPVEDGTEINLSFADSLLVKEQRLYTENGKAYVIFTGGDYTSTSSPIEVRSGSAVAQTDLAIDPLIITITADTTTLKKQQTTDVEVTVTKPDGSYAAGVPVTLSAIKGIFSEQNLITDREGKVRTTFTAGLNETSDEWVAQVGYVAIERMAYQVTPTAGHSINAQDAMLLGDESSAGSVTIDAYGIPVTTSYQTEGTIEVKGAVGGTVTIGDMADPNIEPLLVLQMNQLDLSSSVDQFDDDQGHNPGVAQGIDMVYDHPMGAGRSAQFKSDSLVTIASNPLLALQDNRGFRLDLKPESDGAIVSYAGGALTLAY